MKKISIVITSKNRPLNTQQLIKSLLKHKEIKLEILLMDFSNDNTIDLIYKSFHEYIKNDILKIFFYNKKINSSEIRFDALEHATGDYLWFIYSVDKISKNFLYKMANISEAIDSDIIEFNVKHSGKIDIQSNVNINLEPNKIHNFEMVTSLIGYTSPFLYNKLFKKEFLMNNIKLLKFKSDFDNYYSYVLISLAKSYYYVDVKGATIKTQIIINDYYFLFQQWKLIILYFRNYTNWNIVKKYLEFAFINYVFLTLIPYTQSLELEPLDKIKKEKLIIRYLFSEFPNWQNNSLLRQSPFMKKTHYKKLSILYGKDREKKVKYKRRGKYSEYLTEEFINNINEK